MFSDSTTYLNMIKLLKYLLNQVEQFNDMHL
jgi:hypothetical protein